MPTAGAFAGIGTTLARKNDSTGLFVTIAGVKAISGPELSIKFADTTVLNSPSNFETFIPTVISPGDLSLDLFYDHAEHSNFNSDLSAGAPHFYKITFPNGSTVTVSGYVASIGNEVTVDDAVGADVSFKLSGPVTFA